VLLLAGLTACEFPEITAGKTDASILLVPDSYHDARLATGHLVHLRGEKKIACHECHDVENKGFASPGAAGCVKCHEAQKTFHHGMDAGTVLPDGGEPKEVNCLSCHAFMTHEGLQAFKTPWACLDCHAKPQGTKHEITVHTHNCQQCHVPHRSPITEPAACTDCHDVSLKHGAKGTTIADTCMKCHEHHQPAAKATAKCLECHEKSTMEPAGHVTDKAILEKGHTSCGACHQPHAFVKSQVKPCISCHEDKPMLAPEKHKGCVTCHNPHDAKAPPKACQSCHKDEHVKHPADESGRGCTGCHRPHEKMPAAALAVPCITCHKKADFTAAVVHGDGLDCNSCHVRHEAKPKGLTLCAKCHETPVKAVAKNKGHQDCVSCHVGLPHHQPAQPPPCLKCHEKRLPPQKGHTECRACHDQHSGAVLKTCTQCHEVAKLPGLHAEVKHQECSKCHAPHEPQPGPQTAVCSGCHKTLPKDHPNNPARCSSCHLFTPSAPDAPKGVPTTKPGSMRVPESPK
jgi:hypothetical protein